VNLSRDGALHSEVWESGRLASRCALLETPDVHWRKEPGSNHGGGLSVPWGGYCDNESYDEATSSMNLRHPGAINGEQKQHVELASDTTSPVEEDSQLEFSNVKTMLSWSVRDVAHILRVLGLDASLISIMEAHRVGGAALATLTSSSAASFLASAFGEECIERPNPCRSLLTLVVDAFLKVYRKLSTPQASPEVLSQHFSGLHIEETNISFGEVVGEGGFGRVHRAQWRLATVAAKAFRSGERALAPRNFYAELQVLSNLRHPNVTLLLGYCSRPQFIIITEFVEGGCLHDILHYKQRLPNSLSELFGWAPSKWSLQKAVIVAQEICLGMAYLHSNNVVHCDLKSSNVLITDASEVKICDFGLAQILEAQILDETADHMAGVKAGIVGTPQWMAPEVLRGEDFSAAADVYSFGMVVWEMISRRIPLRGYTAAQVTGIVGYGHWRPQLPKDCPEALRGMLHEILHAHPKYRPSFGKLSVDLQVVRDSAVMDVEECLWTFFAG